MSEISKTLTKKGAKRILRLLEGMRCDLQDGFVGNLSIDQEYTLCLNGRMQDFLAIIETTPNPRFGEAPCCFRKPIILVAREYRDGTLPLSAINDFWNHQKARQNLKDAIKKLKQNSRIYIQTYVLNPIIPH